MIDTLSRQLENRLRAQYLATERESDLINWVEAGIIRHAIEEIMTEQVKQKYLQNAPDWFVKAK